MNISAIVHDEVDRFCDVAPLSLGHSETLLRQIACHCLEPRRIFVIPAVDRRQCCSQPRLAISC